MTMGSHGRHRPSPCITGAMRVMLMLTLMLTIAAGQDDDPNHGVIFIYPTSNQIYNMMDTVNVTYTSPFPTPNLYLWCDGGDRQGKFTPLPPNPSHKLGTNTTK